MKRFLIVFSCFVLLAINLQGQTYIYAAPFAFSTPSQERFTAGVYHKSDNLLIGFDVEVRAVKAETLWESMLSMPVNIGLNMGDATMIAFTGPAIKDGLLGLQSGMKFMHSMHINDKFYTMIQTGLSTTGWTDTDFMFQIGLAYKL